MEQKTPIMDLLITNRVERCNMREEVQECLCENDNTCTLMVKPYEIITLRLTLKL